MGKLHILASFCAAGLLAFGVASASAQTPPAEPWTSLRSTVPLPPPVESGLVDVGDVDLYYAVYGKGPPVVLLHPGLGHGGYWANQIGPISQEFRVVVVDLRGHGRSTASPQALSYNLLADDVFKLIQKLNLTKPAIVGWGDGATVGLELAMRHPGRVGKLVAFGLTYDLSGQQTDVDKTPTFVEYVLQARADYDRLAPPPKDFHAVFRQLEALWSSAPTYAAGDLQQIRTPTYIMAAEHDEWVRLEHMEEAARLIPGAKTVIVARASHFAPWQAPKKFNDALKLMLRN